jgi:hypothetical protein
VFPSFVSSVGEMICSGVLPINQMRDYVEPAAIIASRVPTHLLEAIYGIHIVKEIDLKDNPNRPPTASEFLSAYCKIKGYITAGTGRWDEFRASKDVLRDYNDGKILYANPPPDLDIDIDRWLIETEIMSTTSNRVAERLSAMKLNPIDELTHFTDDLNGDFDSEQGDEIEAEVFSQTTEQSRSKGQSNEKVPKREHKRLKTWGKKGKKLRDKTPYSEENGKLSYIAHTTNRNVIRPITSIVSTA